LEIRAPSLPAPDSAVRLLPPGDKPCRLPVKKAVAAHQHAPSVTIPLRFIVAGVLSLLAGVGLVMVRPDILAGYHYNQYVIAATHLLVLGFVCSVVMGATYQLVPIALETRLFNERLARWHFIAHLAGVAGMVGMFWVWNMKQVGHFGSVVALGAGWFVYNIARTLARVPRWDVIATAVASSLFWLSATVLAGLYLAASKCWDFSPFAPVAAMHAHAHMGVVGVFVTMIVGVSFKLVPMFALSELQNTLRARWSVALLNGGLAGLFVTILLESPLKLAFALLASAGLGLYGLELCAILGARKRRHLDWGLKYFLTAVSLLGPLAVLGCVLAWPGLPVTQLTTQLENVYGFLGIIGVVAFAILGMLYKILPFLVWYRSYSKHIGRGKVPSLAEMYSARLQATGYWLFVAGLIVVSIATLRASEIGVRWGCAVLATSLGVFALNMGAILAHLIRPEIRPLHPRATASGVAPKTA
jgi:hypothetical protein